MALTIEKGVDLKLMLTFFAMLVTVGIAWGEGKGANNIQDKDIARQQLVIEDHSERLRAVETAVISLDLNTKHFTKGFDQYISDQKEQQRRENDVLLRISKLLEKKE